MTSLGQIAEIEAEVVHYRDRLALLRARLYRQGVAGSPRLDELQRRLNGAERRLRAARATAPPWPPEARDGAD